MHDWQHFTLTSPLLFSNFKKYINIQKIVYDTQVKVEAWTYNEW